MLGKLLGTNMARGIHRLTDAVVKGARRSVVKSDDPKRKTLSDGAGLNLVIEPSGSMSWLLNVQVKGRRRYIGLGGYHDVSLGDARGLAVEARKSLKAGVDIVAERKSLKLEAMTFEAAARAVHGENVRTWKNPKHADQWINTLDAYVFPEFGPVAVQDVTGRMVRDALLPIWLEKKETARRVRQRIGRVIGWSVSNGLREHPIDLKAITDGLPRQGRGVKNHASMPHQDVPVFMRELRAMEGTSATVRWAFELLLLTCVRGGELRKMTLGEVDLAARTWSVPGERMKMSIPHVVPLSGRAANVLETAISAMQSQNPDALVFEGERRGRPLSENTFNKVLKRANHPYTSHGFRSSFIDWVREDTNYGSDLGDLCLAHKVGSKVTQAYARSTLLDRRRELMAAWAAYCEGDSDNVVRLAAG
jgi:integrase